MEEIETRRTRRQLWFPQLPLRKWFQSRTVDANLGGTQVTTSANSETQQGTDLTLTQTMTKPDALDQQGTTKFALGGRDHGYLRDPDVNPPETSLEFFFYNMYRLILWFQSMDVVFALKTAAGFVLLSLPAYLPQSVGWFFAWRGQWATITLLLWMLPIVGMFFVTVTLRVIGTVLGGVLGIIVWEIARGNPYGLIVLMFVCMIFFYYIFFTNQIFKVVAIMTQVTLILVVCYEYQYAISGAPIYDSVEVVAGKRMLLVIIGVGASAILSIIPKPITGRVELRKRISKTIRDISRLYSILVSDILITHNTSFEPTLGQIKAFRKSALSIRRQIADENTYLKMSKFEPPLRGKFPYEVYAKLVEKVDNMADLLQGMAFALRSMDKVWKRNLIKVIEEERLHYVANILSIMKLVSSTMASKMALPPFMSSPTEMKHQLVKKLRKAIIECPDHLDNDTFPSYCAYTVNSSKFAEELEEVVALVKQLVGVEDPEQWLLLNA
ncbi:uncharacterized protein BX663DRAFT_444994 [Cokeromyces recurvatus]|uniref:uncharacterized protein n=1 Tax=Cokeromyces recurvatus TaxID=90255 RepID=UPI00221EB465|nr:uncharacterized protein BX663DRAFT_444994 [Cokeromyces recurvatus]KAI7897489.1 hypothetical protein BX663DRAFT_444994 [Cokeromyces recurvatus]